MTHLIKKKKTERLQRDEIVALVQGEEITAALLLSQWSKPLGLVSVISQCRGTEGCEFLMLAVPFPFLMHLRYHVGAEAWIYL